MNITGPMGPSDLLSHLALMLYTGPDQMLPLLSFLGAILGILLLWWQRFLMLVRRLFKSSSEKTETASKNSE